MEETAAQAHSEIRAIRQAQSYRRQSLLTEGLYDERAADQAIDAGIIGGLGNAFSIVGGMPRDSGKKTTRKANQAQGDFYSGRAGGHS
jgi:hypothetical protein